MANTKWGPEYHAEAARLAALGMTYKRIGAEIGVPYQTIATWEDVRTHGPVVKEIVVELERGVPVTDEAVRGIAEMGIDQGLSVREIAEKLGASAGIVRRVRYGDDPVMLAYRREKYFEAADFLLGQLMGLMKRAAAAPINSFQQGAVGIEKLTKALVDLMNLLGGNDGADESKKSAMDLAALIREGQVVERSSLRIVDSTASPARRDAGPGGA